MKSSKVLKYLLDGIDMSVRHIQNTLKLPDSFWGFCHDNLLIENIIFPNYDLLEVARRLLDTMMMNINMGPTYQLMN